MTRWKTSLLSLLLIFQFSAHAASGPVPATANPALPLSPKDVANLILKQSYQAQEIDLQAQAARYNAESVVQLYDFQLYADYGYQDSKFASPTQTYILEDKSLITNVQLAKPFISGTLLTLVYTSTSGQPTYGMTAPTPAQDLTNSSVGLILEQNLLRNFFGVAQRADLSSAQNTLKAANIARVSNLQNLVLRAIQSFWSTYMAQQTYQAAMHSRDRYSKLVDSIKKKSGYGYTGPGELAQAQAELENREQTVRSSLVSYQAAQDELLTLLRLPAGREIQFILPENLPPPPVATPVEIEKLRPQQAASLGLRAAEDTLRATQSKAYPDLSLVGKYYTQGFDEQASVATRQLTDNTRPKYYVGVRFQYNFGSDFQNESILNKRIARDLAQTQLQRQKLELQDQENDILRTIQSTYAIAQSSQTQRGLREKAIQELTRSYNQGRTDIAILIDALNKYFDSEVQLSRALGNYQTSLTEWAAFRDELVSNPPETSN